MVSEAITLYIAGKILTRFIAHEPWTKRIIAKIFPPVKYKNRLAKCINKTIEEYERKHKSNFPSGKFPFYHSQILFNLLSQYMLFDNSSVELIEEEFEKNSNIIKPQKGELKEFYQLFLNNVDADEVLKTKFIDENYKEKIFQNASKLGPVLIKLNEISTDTTEILTLLKDPNYQRNSSKELTSYLPILNNNTIINRDDDLVDVHNRLLKNKQLVLVNGMGGIGKTTLAQLYITKYYGTYKYLIWVSISSDDFISDFNQTEGLINSLHVSPQDKSPKELFNALIMAIKGLPHTDAEQSIMVIDNAEDDFSKYCDFLPHPPHWNVLATSRHKLPDFDVKELDFLNEEQSIALFKLYYQKDIISNEEIKNIVKELEYHTLTIEILAKTANYDNLDVEETISTITENYQTDVKSRHAEGKIDKITSYLSSIFDMSKLSIDEIWLLKQFYFLPPQFHTFHILETILTPAINEKQFRLQRILSRLSEKGWLLCNEQTNEYKLHRIIGDVINHSTELAFNDIALLVNCICSLLSIDQAKDNPVDKFQWIVFGNSLLKQLSGEHTDDEENLIGVLQNNLALRLKDTGDFHKAKQLLEKAIISAEKNFEKELPTTAIRYSNLAMVLKDLGDYDKAKELLKKVVVFNEKRFGTEHPETAVSYSNLASVLKELGDFTGAKKLFGKAIILDEKNFGPEHPSTARSYSNLAMVLQDLGDYIEAKVLLEKAVVSNEKNFGKEHPTIAVSYSNLALVLKDLGDFTGAKELLGKAIIIDEKNLGKEHPTTAIRYSNLATVLQDLGDFTRAKELLEKAIIIDEKNFGKDHPTTAVRYSNLALVLKDLGDYTVAKELLEKAIIIDEKNFGKEHPTTAVSYSNLALVLKDLGDYTGAKELLEKAIISEERNFGMEHPTTAVGYFNLATVFYNMGDYTEVKELLEKAVLIFEQKLGKQHPNSKTVRENLDYLNEEMKTK